MSLLLIGLIVFLGVHSVSIVAPGWRDAQLARRGEALWKGGYALLSALGFALIVWGYGLARQSPVLLYSPPAGLRHAALLLMVPVFPLLLAAYLPGRIQRAAKHPMLLATKLWATAHLLANGTAHDVLLFGAFLAWAVADRISLKRRVPRAVPGAPPSAVNDAIALVGGLAIYVVFVLWAHRWLIGVAAVGLTAWRSHVPVGPTGSRRSVAGSTCPRASRALTSARQAHAALSVPCASHSFQTHFQRRMSHSLAPVSA